MTCDEYKAALASAESAFHTLNAGGAIARVRHGDKEVQYQPGNIAGLLSYITFLRNRLNAECGTCYQTRRVLRLTPI